MPRLRVLILDDEVIITNALQRSLAAEHDVTVQNDPVAALAAIREGATFDVILCDLVMPGKTGVQVLRELRAFAPAQAAGLILMTGGSVTGEVTDLLASGLPNLPKPFDLEELRRMIVRVADR